MENEEIEALKYLKYANFAFAGLDVLLGLFMLLGGLAVGGYGMTSGAEMMSWLIPLVLTVVSAVLLFVFGGLFYSTGKKVAVGEGKIMQSVLCLFTIFSFPIGTLYAGYALYLLYGNEETKGYFS